MTILNSVDVYRRPLYLVVAGGTTQNVTAVDKNFSRSCERNAGIAALEHDLALCAQHQLIVVSLHGYQLWGLRALRPHLKYYRALSEHAQDDRPPRLSPLA